MNEKIQNINELKKLFQEKNKIAFNSFFQLIN